MKKAALVMIIAGVKYSSVDALADGSIYTATFTIGGTIGNDTLKLYDTQYELCMFAGETITISSVYNTYTNTGVDLDSATVTLCDENSNSLRATKTYTVGSSDADEYGYIYRSFKVQESGSESYDWVQLSIEL